MRSDVEVRLGPGDRERLEAVLADRNSAQKHVWRARIILATAEGCGTMEIMRRAGVSKPLRLALAAVDRAVHAAHQEFIRFLNRLERDIPAGKLVHVVLDNYGSHKHPKVRTWLSRHPRWIFHFMPTSASWLNAVEGFFARLSSRRLRRGVFHSLVDLQAAINRYLAEHNHSPKPFVWTADPNAHHRRRESRVPSVRFDPLATLTRNTVRFGRNHTAEILATPTEIQRRAFALLAIKPAP